MVCVPLDSKDFMRTKADHSQAQLLCTIRLMLYLNFSKEMVLFGTHSKVRPDQMHKVYMCLCTVLVKCGTKR